MKEKLENIKVYCPTCLLSHNLSSKDIEIILQLFHKEVEKAMPEESIYMEDQKTDVDLGIALAKQEIRITLLKAIGGK